MIKKICFFSLLPFLLLQCGNEQSDFPGSSGIGGNNSPPVEYKIFTPVLYKAPYTSEMLYHLISLANFNKIDSSFFLFFDIDSPDYKNQMEDFLSKRKDQINILTLGVVPREIPLIEKIQPYITKAVFLFPTEKPAFTPSLTTSGSSTTISTQVFPANYNYMSSTIKLRYSLQDKTFLAATLKNLTGGNINTPPISNVNEIAYIQGESRPQTTVRVSQGDTSDTMKEKISMTALDDGSITGIPIDPSQNTQIVLSYEKNQTTYWIGDMGGSFLFFNFPFLPENQIDILSYFVPLKIENLSFAGNPLELDKDNKKKAIYGLHITIDPSADGKTKSFTGDYRNGELTLKISPDLVPVSYSIKDMTMNLSGSSAIKLLTEVKETKKDYNARSTTGGTLTLHVADQNKDQKPEESSSSASN